MKVFDGDPELLEWKSGKGSTSILVLYVAGEGRRKETAISGMVPPTDVEFEALLKRAKNISLQYEEETSVFVAMERRLSKDNVLPPLGIAEYLKGELVAFCRPPWRLGESLY